MSALALLAPVLFAVAVPPSMQSLERRTPAVLYKVEGDVLEGQRSTLGVLGDVDGDGVSDFALGGVQRGGYGSATVVSGRDGRELFRVAEEPESIPEGGFRDDVGSEVTGTGDLDGDGIRDFAVCPAHPGSSIFGPGDSICLYSGSTGELLSKFLPRDGGAVFHVWDLGDVDGNGRSDIGVVDGYRGGCQVYEGSSWTRLFSLGDDVWAAWPTLTEAGAVDGFVMWSRPGDVPGDRLTFRRTRLGDEAVLEQRQWITERGTPHRREIVRDLDGDRVPDVLFLYQVEHFDKGGVRQGCSEYFLVAFSTRSGQEIYSVPVWSARRESVIGVAVSELEDRDGDSIVALLLLSQSGDGEPRPGLVFHSLKTGQHLWSTAPVPGVPLGSCPSHLSWVDDLDRDGMDDLAVWWSPYEATAGKQVMKEPVIVLSFAREAGTPAGAETSKLPR